MVGPDYDENPVIGWHTDCCAAVEVESGIAKLRALVRVCLPALPLGPLHPRQEAPIACLSTLLFFLSPPKKNAPADIGPHTYIEGISFMRVLMVFSGSPFDCHGGP